jgi:hypothetical protein
MGGEEPNDSKVGANIEGRVSLSQHCIHYSRNSRIGIAPQVQAPAVVVVRQYDRLAASAKPGHYRAFSTDPCSNSRIGHSVTNLDGLEKMHQACEGGARNISQ